MPPGIEGNLKSEPEDFVVEEIPAYFPTGKGDHLFIWIEKRQTSAESLLQHVAATIEVRRDDIGMAGQKDRWAVTRQYISVPATAAGRLSFLEHENIRVLHTGRHPHKLRTGHLRGNRFNIFLRGVRDDDLPRAERIAAQIKSRGIPNFYGRQRFGHNSETLSKGLDLLRGTTSPSQLPRARRRYLLRLFLGAAQSYLFNAVLAQRMTDDLVDRVLPGDVLQVVTSGGPFVATGLDTEQLRLEQREIAITGPMFGRKMSLPSGVPLKNETAALAASGLVAEDFDRFKKLTRGTRRPLLVFPGNLSVRAEQDGLRFRFELPKGSYGTVLMREFTRKW